MELQAKENRIEMDWRRARAEMLSDQASVAEVSKTIQLVHRRLLDDEFWREIQRASPFTKY